MTVLPLLDRPTYLYAEVDRLVGLRPGTARRWINGYDRAGKHYEPILRLTSSDTEWVTWGEFVEARILAEYRDQDVPTAKLRPAVDQLRQQFQISYPLAYWRPYLAADNNELTMQAARLDTGAEGHVVLRTGQRILRSGRGLFETTTLTTDGYGEKFATEVPLDPAFPGIKVHPDRLSGQPTFEGRRIAVATVAELVSSGEARDDVAASYRLSLSQVRDAKQYARKHRLTAA